MNDSLHVLHTQHGRHWRRNRFVYPVLSRRSRGLSLGVNLNPDKICNFDCIYCQIDRRSESETRFVELDDLLAELDGLLTLVTTGRIYEDESFASVPENLRRLNDIAFSGDGEPTTHVNLDEVVELVAERKRRLGLDDVKLVLITNASMFHRPHVQRGLELFDQNNGEIWAKLDAGSEAYYDLVERTKIPFARVLENITAAARVRPLVIQSLFMRVAGEPPTAGEIEAFCDRLNEVVAAGGGLKLVQIYTVARRPAEDFVTSLTDAEVDGIADRVAERTGLPVERYYGR